MRRIGLDPTVVVADNGGVERQSQRLRSGRAQQRRRARVSRRPRRMRLVQYVAEGGSLAMVGGDQSFGLGGWQDSPIARVMPVS